MKNIAIFDFDNTLIRGDSFLPFVLYVAGPLLTAVAVIEGLGLYVWRKARGVPTKNFRTFFKGFLIYRLIGGKPKGSFEQAIKQTKAWQKFNEPIVKTLKEHHEKGDTILIASGSLNLYLEDLLSDIPHDAVICTDVEIQDGFVIGKMIHGNCVRKQKAARIKKWLEENGPFGESYGYGNAPHDLPMLELVQNRIIVS